jgi:hypothetical protein
VDHHYHPGCGDLCHKAWSGGGEASLRDRVREHIACSTWRNGDQITVNDDQFKVTIRPIKGAIMDFLWALLWRGVYLVLYWPNEGLMVGF